MGRGRFYKDQIVRRQAHDKMPIGPYLRVIRTERDRIYADVIGHNEPNVILLKKDVYAYTQYSLTVSEDMLYRLKQGTTVCVQHDVDSYWQRVYEKQPELIRFYTRMKNYEGVFTIENIRKVLSLNEPMIRIIVANRVV